MKRDPLPIDEASHYLGFYNLRCGKVEGVKSECYHLRVKWAPEDDEDSHFHIELIEYSNELSKKQKRSERAIVSVLLAQCLIGPTRHVCTIDEPVRGELEQIEVETLVEQAE